MSQRPPVVFVALVACLCLTGASCAEPEEGSVPTHGPVIPSEAGFPADFFLTYTIVTNCLDNAEHGGKRTVTYVNQVAEEALNLGVTEFPEGSVFVMAQYDNPPGGLSSCAGVASAYTAMRKDPPGSGTDSDWRWQQVTESGLVRDGHDVAACQTCHSAGTDFVMGH